MSNKTRYAARSDENQKDIVRDLRRLGFIIETGHDDFLACFNGLMFWIELKSENAVSKKTGKILESKIKDSQKRIRSIWNDTYIIAATLEQIVEGMNRVFRRHKLPIVRIK